MQWRYKARMTHAALYGYFIGFTASGGRSPARA
jgi:hypothetical protein